ncbi:MAG TPA: sulfate permease [Candidatus Limnocylindrales bacterium]|nr:sulfate permease [Candidatus Limnocylindrales bacterium]
METSDVRPSQPAAWTRYVPILSWLPHYDRSWLNADLLAGLTLWGLIVPEAMAYAGLAGLPPQAGLYTLVVALLVYALFGTSRHLVVGATSATSVLLASTVAVFGAAAATPEGYRAYASALVIVVGAVFLIAGIARLGFITQFLSKPVMDGFITGLALFVMVGQLNKLLGVSSAQGNTVEKLVHLVRELPNTNVVSLLVGLGALVVLFLLPRLSKKIPAGLVVLFGFILLSSALDLSGRYGVETVGVIPGGLPAPSIPDLSIIRFNEMVLPAIGIVLVAYSESLGVAREFSDKHHYEVDPDQELRALGAVNLASGMFSGQLAGGSMSASAVKEGSGGRSQMANLVTWGAALLTLLFLTPLFASLPEAVLGALIIHAVWHIVAERKLQEVRLASRSEFWLGALALAGVLLVDVLEGMVIGLLASVLLVLYRSSRPHIAALGRAPGAEAAYTDLDRHPENQPVAGMLVLRIDGPLYFASALTVREDIRAQVAAAGPGLRAVVVDFAAQDKLDITGAQMLVSLVRDLQRAGITLIAANVHAPVIDFSRNFELEALFGEGRVYASVAEAVAAVTPAV